MNVTSQVSFDQGDGRQWRKIAVGLGHHDLIRLVAEGKVPGYEVKKIESDGDERWGLVNAEGGEMPVAEMFKFLMRQADTLVIYQMAKEGALTADQAREQIAAL